MDGSTRMAAAHRECYSIPIAHHSLASSAVAFLVWCTSKHLLYIDLVDSELMNLASVAVQRHFYQEAGIKRAAFMGCKNGEIEIGMSSSAKIDMNMIQQFFSEDFVQQFQIVDHSHPSSSSSLRSLSVGSPEYSSLFINKPSASFFPDFRRDAATTPSEHRPAQLISTTIPPHRMAMSAYSQHHNVQLPTPASDDAAIMRAMLAVISSGAPSSSSSPFPHRPPDQDQASQGQTSRRHTTSAFKPYDPILDSHINIEPGSVRAAGGGQRMIKMGISMLRRINMTRAELAIRESQPSSSNQLHHMISERKRREKINQSFLALRMLLPPGSKKDKASVLSNTTNYVKALKAQISELEERNKMLEMQSAAATDITAADHELVDPKERVAIEIVRSSESTSETLRINLRVTAVVDCDMVDLAICVLECLKEMGVVTMTSINAVISQTSPFARVVNVTLHVKASEWEEESFKGAVTGAVNGLVAALPETTNF
ncbi:putative receptor-like protein kinase [Iris pallida]|uniref:Receptor-like protein kinase n=1 Tax=Iris pallida TaxID=29817 RepID=A0AAX6FS73_IRIPA|nr:putative receptor-like protein kinase [Iris pallida]